MAQTLENEIKKFEKAGIHVQCVQEDGKVAYQTKVDFNTCNSCAYLRLLPDPDPSDWFDDDDQKAICGKIGKKIEGALSVFEASRVEIPSWCPKKEK